MQKKAPSAPPTPTLPRKGGGGAKDPVRISSPAPSTGAGRGGGELQDAGASGDPRSAIREKALGLGFDAVGFAKATLAATAREGLAGFLAAGYHGDMGWMAEKADRRGDPKLLWPEARSVVVLGLNYGPPSDPLADRPGSAAGPQ